MRNYTSLILVILITFISGISGAEPVSIPGIVTITASAVEDPPGWAIKQRELIKKMEEAAPLFLDKFAMPSGFLREHGKIDDDYECFISWPLFYAMGGEETILVSGLKEYNAITRQWTYGLSESVHKEFMKQNDMLHLSEAYVGFQYFGLADPGIPENIDRSRRFAGFYMNEDPEAPNYDPEYKIIRSISTGSIGPADHMDGWYMITYGHASLYPIIKDLNPDWGEEIQELYDEIVVPCDAVINLSITGLVTHAYLLTGDEKYKDWVLGYVDAWMDRIEENNGIIPDNIGRTGKIGEYRNGQWWGGFFGWSSRYSLEIMFNGIITASECAHLISGDDRYLDLLRSQIDVLLNNSREGYGNLLVPYKYGPDGWYDYRPMMPHVLSHLWHASLDPEDWERIERVREGSTYGPRPYAYATSPDPPEPSSEEWYPDGSIVDWNKVLDNIGSFNENRLNEKPHLRFLAGDNPDWPEKIMQGEFDMLNRNIARINDENYRHEWSSHTMVEQRPILTNGLQQITMGAPHTCFNGGLLRAHVRYFDISSESARPGLPLDVAALVEKIHADSTVVYLVNLSETETRELIIQAGAYGEHEFTEVRYRDHADNSQTEKTVRKTINNKYFAVELPPATSIRLNIGNRRFVNTPTYAFPWHEQGNETYAEEDENHDITVRIHRNYPNPFNLETAIEYEIPANCPESFITLSIYNVYGQKIRTIISGKINPGIHSVRWDGKDYSGKAVSAGIYFTRLEAGKSISVSKMMLIK